MKRVTFKNTTREMMEVQAIYSRYPNATSVKAKDNGHYDVHGSNGTTFTVKVNGGEQEELSVHEIGDQPCQPTTN